MRANRKPFKIYESPNKGGYFVMLPNSLLDSDKFLNLSSSAKILYIYMKKDARGQEEFIFTQKRSLKYVCRSSATFQSAKQELIDNGFIEVVRASKCSRTPNKYKFSPNWHKKK